MIALVCHVCGNEYQVRPYRENISKFCSQKCAGYHHFTVNNPSQKINSHLHGNKYRQGKRPTNAFKSEEVSGAKSNKWKGGPLVRPCDWCGKPVERERNQVTRNEHFFCDRDCFAEWKSHNWGREGNPSWRGGHANYYGPDWKRQARLARKRDGERCQVCGLESPERKLDVHHIIRFGDFETSVEANSMDNLITVCHSCHMALEYNRAEIIEKRLGEVQMGFF